MSLRKESLRAYRKLFSISAKISFQCPLHNKNVFLEYISSRFNHEAQQNSRRIAHAMLYLDRKENDLLNKVTEGQRLKSKKSSSTTRRLNVERKKIIRDYETRMSNNIDMIYRLAELLPHAVGNASLTSVLQVLAAGVGNTAYQRRMESGFTEFFNFEQKKMERDEAVEEATSERQNRIMQQALIPYAERLLLLHRTAVGENNSVTNLLYLTPWQMTEGIVGARSGVSAYHLRHGNDHVVVEIDEVYNKQVIYVACACAGAGTQNGSYDWEQEVEGVEISECDEVRRTIFHAEFLSRATPMCTTLLHETPLHVSRRTVLVGHAVGGSVALILSLLLSQRGFEVSNVITLGAPKALQGTLERYVAAINPIRVVLAGDPLVELPVTGAQGNPFVHVGEILLLTPCVQEETSMTGTTSESEKSSSRDGSRSDLCTPSVSTSSAAISSVPGCSDGLTADKLDMLMSDATFEASLGESSNSGDFSSTLYPQPKFESHTRSPSSGMREKVDSTLCVEKGEFSENQGAEEASGEAERLFSVAKERYCAQYLVEHYVQQLCDPNVVLTYAEGDEIWDEGSYAETRREAERTLHVSFGERFQRDLRGPL